MSNIYIGNNPFLQKYLKTINSFFKNKNQTYPKFKSKLLEGSLINHNIVLDINNIKKRISQIKTIPSIPTQVYVRRLSLNSQPSIGCGSITCGRCSYHASSNRYIAPQSEKSWGCKKQKISGTC